MSTAVRSARPLTILALTVAGGAALAATSGTARADRRAFTQTYEYSTTPEDQTEVELHTTQSRATFDGNASPQLFQLELEIEHGITDRWDIALYHVFEQTSDGMGGQGGLALHKMTLETRYRVKERGELPVDIVLYGEVAKDFGASVYEFEGKVILARDFGKLTAAANLVGEVETGGDVPEAELELGFAAGLSYELSPTWKLGAETWGGLHEAEAGAAEEDVVEVSAGPAISWAPAPRLWISGTAGFGLTDDSPAATVAAIVGLML